MLLKDNQQVRDKFQNKIQTAGGSGLVPYNFGIIPVTLFFLSACYLYIFVFEDIIELWQLNHRDRKSVV